MKKKLNLREIQKVEFDAMKVFIDLCEKYQIRYYLSGGTLLGAVRHKGFIPWDDDIDLMMPRADYDRLLEHAEEIGQTGIYKLAACELGNLKYPFAKIYDLRTTIQKVYDDNDTERNLWVDIFPIDGLPLDLYKSTNLFRRVMFERRLYLLKQSRDGEGKTAVRAKLKPMLKKVLRPINDEKLLKHIVSLCRSCKVEDSEYIGALCICKGPQERMPKKPFLKEKEVEFEGITCKAPGCTDYYLRRLYGEYMQLPPEDQRQTHAMEVWMEVPV